MARASQRGTWAAAAWLAAAAFAVFHPAAARDRDNQPRDNQPFAVNQIWFTIAGPGRFLHADMHIPESQPLRQTLESGLEIDFSLQVAVQRKRWWWLDQRAAETNWRATVEYDSILRRYRLATADGYRREYQNLRDALNRLGQLRHWPLSPSVAPVLDDPDAYILARLEVDVSRLPQPVKILLLTDDEWDFSSGWTRLPLRVQNENDPPPPTRPVSSDPSDPAVSSDSADPPAPPRQ